MAISAPSVASALALATERLERAGCESARLDAELLLGEVLSLDRAGLVLQARRSLSAGEADLFATLQGRRAAREPVAYITGRRAFRFIELQVDPRVLIPRAETELLVDAALTLSHGLRVADVGTGSGAVALAVAHERPDLHVVGTDISGGALAVARANAARLGLPVDFVQGDLLAGMSADAVVANLPYVAERERAMLAPEIDRYEPDGALFGGEDGLAVIRRLVSSLGAEVRCVALEVGHHQARAVAPLLTEAGCTTVRCLRDLAGHERVVTGRR